MNEGWSIDDTIPLFDGYVGGGTTTTVSVSYVRAILPVEQVEAIAQRVVELLTVDDDATHTPRRLEQRDGEEDRPARRHEAD